MKNRIFTCLRLFCMLIICNLIQPLLNAKDKGVPCNTRGIVIDEDPNGLNLRESPKGKIITQIPINADVEIKKFDSGWMYVTDITYDNMEKNQGFVKKHKHILKLDGGVVYLKSLRGWVYAQKLGTYIRNYDPRKSYWLTENANEKSKRIIKVTESYSPNVKLLECKGDWLKVEYKKIPGWLAPGLDCPAAYTSCS